MSDQETPQSTASPAGSTKPVSEALMIVHSTPAPPPPRDGEGERVVYVESFDV